MSEIAPIEAFKLINGKLPWCTSIGMYPLVYLDAKDRPLCSDCATERMTEPDENFRTKYGGINYSDDCLECECCGEQIEAAYDDDDDDDDDDGEEEDE